MVSRNLSLKISGKALLSQSSPKSAKFVSQVQYNHDRMPAGMPVRQQKVPPDDVSAVHKEGLIPRDSGQTIDVPEFPADPFLFLVEVIAPSRSPRSLRIFAWLPRDCCRSSTFPSSRQIRSCSLWSVIAPSRSPRSSRMFAWLPRDRCRPSTFPSSRQIRSCSLRSTIAPSRSPRAGGCSPGCRGIPAASRRSRVPGRSVPLPCGVPSRRQGRRGRRGCSPGCRGILCSELTFPSSRQIRSCFLEEVHRAVEVAAGLEDHRLVAEGSLQRVDVPEFPADPFLFLVEFHRTVKVAADLEDVRLVSEGSVH